MVVEAPENNQSVGAFLFQFWKETPGLDQPVGSPKEGCDIDLYGTQSGKKKDLGTLT